VVTERQHLVDSIAELTLLCNEATRRRKPDAASSVPSTKKLSKPLSIEYIFDRIDTDDPIWGLMVRTDTPVSFKGRPSNLKASPLWKRGMLQGFITMTTFTNWQSSFRFDSLHEMAFGQDDDELEEQMKNGIRKYDEDGSLAEELEASVKGGNPHIEGIVYPRIAEVSLFGGLGCGKQLLRLLVEHLERLKATVLHNYDYIVLQATENSIPFYESMGFVRVGCIQGKTPSPNKYHCSPVEEYHTKKHGETPASVAKDFGVDAWDVVFLSKPLWPELVQKSWLKKGTKLFVPKLRAASKAGSADAKSTPTSPKWYMAEENETPRGIAKKFNVDFSELLQANKKRYPDLVGNSRLMPGTRIQVSRFDIDEGNSIAYSHWTFPDAADEEDDDPSYMMALKLDRKKGQEAKVKPVADSLAVTMQPYVPEATGVKELLLQTEAPKATRLAPVFTGKKPLKEPKKPKRPMSSYAHYTVEARSSMTVQLQGKSIVEINKILSEKWKAMSDEDKLPYQEKFEASKAAYNEAMKKYEAEMDRFRRESPMDTSDIGGGVDTSLLEKVVKLKSADGLSGASKFEYYYVLTFIPDLQWVHLIPMRKVGVFGPEHRDAKGRPIWMIVGEDEGKEMDTTASLCKPVTALTMKNSADADDEQWDIYDNGEVPPPLHQAPIFTPKSSATVPNAPLRPKKPATSFAFFCADAKSVMKEQLENKLISERTKLIAERWKIMTDEEKQKYKDQQTEAKEKYTKALKQYKEDLEKFQRENPGLDISSISAISHKTPKSAKKLGTPLNTRDAPSSSAISSKTPKSTKKIRTPLNTGNGEHQKKKRGRPRKHPLPSPDVAEESSDVIKETPTPKRKRGRPRKSPLPNDSNPETLSRKSVMHTVKKDPMELEKLLCKMAGDKSPQTQRKTSSKPGERDIILSLTDKNYKETMWRYFNILGTTRDSQRENEICKEVITFLKEKMGDEGSFFKRSLEKDYRVNDAAAREKIMSDIRRRVSTAQNWWSSSESQHSPKQSDDLSLPVRAVTSEARDRGDNGLVLSLLNEKYKSIMWCHFKKLGGPKGRTGEEEKMGRKILDNLKQELGPRGRFYKKAARGDARFEVNDDVALQKIIRDLKRRMDTSHNWLDVSSVDERPRLTPTRNARKGCQIQINPAAVEAKPQLSPSRRRREAQPESIREAADVQSASCSSSKDTTKRPLAPIFLRSYGKKKNQTPPVKSEDPKRSPRKTRYPERKRKQVIDDDSHVVSDDATSIDIVEPRKKRAKTNC